MNGPFLLSISVFYFQFSSLVFFVVVPCGRLSYLYVSFWAHVNLHRWTWSWSWSSMPIRHRVSHIGGFKRRPQGQIQVVVWSSGITTTKLLYGRVTVYCVGSVAFCQRSEERQWDVASDQVFAEKVTFCYYWCICQDFMIFLNLD